MRLPRGARDSRIATNHTLPWQFARLSDFTAADWVVIEDVDTVIDQKITVMLNRCVSIRLLYPSGQTIACMAAALATAGGESDAMPSRLFDLVGLFKSAVIRARTAFGSPMQCQAAATLLNYPATPAMLPTDLLAQYHMPAAGPKELVEHARFAGRTARAATLI